MIDANVAYVHLLTVVSKYLEIQASLCSGSINFRLVG